MKSSITREFETTCPLSGRVRCLTAALLLAVCAGSSLAEAPAKAIPGETEGQRLLWRETFDAPVIDAGQPGTLDGVETGRLLSQLPNGPTWLEDGREASWSAAIRNRTPEENRETMTVFRGFRHLPAEAAERGMAAIWIRPSSRQQIRPGGFFTLSGLQYGQEDKKVAGVGMATREKKLILSTDYQTLIQAMGREPQKADPARHRLIDLDEWALLWIAYDRAEGIEVWVQTAPDAEPQLVGRRDSPGGDWSLRKLVLNAGGSANQGNFAGRIGPVSVYAIDSLEDGRRAPGGMRWPDNAPTTWRVSPHTEDQDLADRTLGGFAALAEAVQDNVVLSRVANAWTDADGDPAGYETLGDAESKKQWWLDWKAGKYRPMGDRIEFEPGVYRRTVGLPLSDHGGIHYTLVDGAGDFSADIRMSESLRGGWSQPDPDQYPLVWRYEGEPHPGRHVWGRDWQSFNVFFTTEGTETAIQSLNGRPWAAFTDAEGVTYISLPEGLEPSDIGPLEGSRYGGNMWNGAWLGRLLIQGSAGYHHTTAKHDKARAAYALGVSGGPQITVIQGRGLRCAKHPAAFVGTQAEGLCIWHQTDVGFDPPGSTEGDPPGFGVGTGAFTPLVDFSSAPTTMEKPGRIVTIYDEVTYREPTEPGDGTTEAKPARRAMYYAHGVGSNAHMFERVIVRNPVADFFRAPAPETGLVHYDEPRHAASFEVIREE